jgi:LPS export ABC transporter protein LptC
MKNWILHSIMILFIVSCKNDMDVIRNLTKANDMPDISGENVEIIYTDSMTIKMKLVAPKLIRYDKVKEPYYEFPKGLHVYNYDGHKKMITDIVAEWATYNEVKRQWHVKNNVVAHNYQKNEQLNTEELFWDETKASIFSDKFVRITNKSGVFFGERGFESDQYMNHWKLIGSKGTLNVKEKK